MKKIEVSEMYLIVHRKLLEREGCIISTRELLEVLKRHFYQFSTTTHYETIKDFQKLGWIEKLSKRNYRITQDYEDKTRRLLSPLLLFPIFL